MKISVQQTLLGAALALSLTTGAFAQINTEKAKAAGDEASAIAFAEKDPMTLELIGGAAKLSEARPWTATGHGETWVILSKPVADPKNPSGPKRAIIVSVNADTGKVEDVSPF